MNSVSLSPSGDAFFLKTARIAFRCWTRDDLSLAEGLWGDPEVTRYLGGSFSRNQIREKLEIEIATMDTVGIQYWPFFLLPELQHVGCAGLRPRFPEEKIYEVGYHLRPMFWRKGLAEEASRAVIAFAFERLGAKELFAGHHPENMASRKVLEKLGFRFTHYELYPPTGEMHPGYELRKPVVST